MKKIINLITISFFLLRILSTYAQVPAPAPAQTDPILLRGATIHVGNGEIIQGGSIGFDQGKITYVGPANSMDVPSGYNVLEMQGKHIYPGFILLNSQVGLSEVSSIRAMEDAQETGQINPNVRSIISYNTDSEMVPTFRFNGILLAETTPQGGLISGSSSVVEMEGWNWEDAAHTLDVGLHLNWPVKNQRQFDFNTFTVNDRENENYSKQVSDLVQIFKDAQVYAKSENPVKNLKLEAMTGLFSGSKKLFIHAGTAEEIIEAIQTALNHQIKNLVLITAEESLFVIELLKENQIPVVIPPTHSLPSRPDEPVFRPYELPHMLSEAGIMVSMYHDDALANARNLPFYAGTAVAYGMQKEEALKMITSNAAKILGIDQRVGTLETGKDATLFVSEGDALDIRTNQLIHAFIRGKKIQLDGRQQELYQRFSEKYGH